MDARGQKYHRAMSASGTRTAAAMTPGEVDDEGEGGEGGAVRGAVRGAGGGGAWVGAVVGLAVVGAAVGSAVGSAVGTAVGALEGTAVGLVGECVHGIAEQRPATPT